MLDRPGTAFIPRASPGQTRLVVATDDVETPLPVMRAGSALTAPRVARAPRLAPRSLSDEESTDPADEPTVADEFQRHDRVATSKLSVRPANTAPNGRTFVMRFGRAAS